MFSFVLFLSKTSQGWGENMSVSLTEVPSHVSLCLKLALGMSLGKSCHLIRHVWLH